MCVGLRVFHWKKSGRVELYHFSATSSIAERSIVSCFNIRTCSRASTKTNARPPNCARAANKWRSLARIHTQWRDSTEPTTNTTFLFCSFSFLTHTRTCRTSSTTHHAQIIGIMSVFFICVSILSFCLKTHPDMRVPFIKNFTVSTANGSASWVLDKTQTNAHIAFFYIECVCNAWFTIEIMVRRTHTTHIVQREMRV